MAAGEQFAPELQTLVGQQVVVDTKAPFVYIGTLDAVHKDSLRLRDVDVHDTRESTSSVDRYLLDAVKYGVRPNRRVVYVLIREIVSISPLSDVVLY